MEPGVGLGPTPALRALAAVVGGPLAIVCFAVFGFDLEGLVAALFATVLVALALVDLEERRIPNVIVLPATAIVLVLQIVREPGKTIEWIVAALAAAAFFLLPMVVYRGGVGMGDVKLALLLGVALGSVVPIALMIGMLSALVPASVLLVRHGQAARKMELPFGSYLALGGVAALFFGDALLDAYLGLL
jgi:leader peptidase (prepilin peptidase) / N-methyltransferase